MTELRQLLEIGAGAPPPAPDLAAVKARGRARARRRRVLAAAAIAAAVAIPSAALPRPVEQVMVLGRPASRVTFEVRADRWLPAGTLEGCDCQSVTLADTPDNPFAVGEDETAQVTVVDGEQPGLVVTLVLPATGTDPDALADANRIVNSITVI